MEVLRCAVLVRADRVLLLPQPQEARMACTEYSTSRETEAGGRRTEPLFQNMYEVLYCTLIDGSETECCIIEHTGCIFAYLHISYSSTE